MYLILDSQNLIKEISRHPSYVRRQSNGVVILSEKEQADAIYSNDSDSFYPLERIGYLCDVHRLIEVENIPNEVAAGYYYYHAGEFYTYETNLSALAKSRAPEIANLLFIQLAETEQIDDGMITKYAEQFPAWSYPANYAQGAICRHTGKLYRCLQAHTSQETWTPDAAPSQWKEIGDPTGEWPEWSQPIGAVDTYAKGAKVSHNGKHWISTVDNNVWEPGVYGWEEAIE